MTDPGLGPNPGPDQGRLWGTRIVETDSEVMNKLQQLIGAPGYDPGRDPEDTVKLQQLLGSQNSKQCGSTTTSTTVSLFRNLWIDGIRVQILLVVKFELEIENDCCCYRQNFDQWCFRSR